MDYQFGSPLPDMSGLGALSDTTASEIEAEEETTIPEPPSLATQYQTEFFRVHGLVRSDTPETLLTEFTNRPDITIKCDRCGIYIDLVALREHRAYHSALTLLKYKGSNYPQSAEVLLRRRNAVIKHLLKQSSPTKPFEPKQVQVINEAYELLKSNLEDTFDEYRAVRDTIDTKVQGLALSCSPGCVDAVGICGSGNDRWKGYMEDTRVYQDCFGDDVNKCYAALFDGHHGRFAAEIAAAKLHQLLLNEMTKFDSDTKSTIALNLAEATDISGYEFNRPDTRDSEWINLEEESISIVQQIISLCEEKYAKLIESRENTMSGTQKRVKKQKVPRHPLQPKIAEAFKKVYEFLDILLSYGKDECSKVRWSGCSALTVIVQNTDKEDNSNQLEGNDKSLDTPVQLGLIHIANAGNVHGLLVRGNHGYQLTKDHTPYSEKERKRVLLAGGTISESIQDCQVNGILSTTRGLGNHGDLNLKKCMLVEPHTMCVPIDQYAQFLVLATHGVWEVFSIQEVTSLLLKHFRKKMKLLPSHQIPAPSNVSQSLRPLLNLPEQSEFGDWKVSFSGTDPAALSKQTIINQEGSERSGTLQDENLSSIHNQNEMLTIEADLKTEVGSHVEDGDLQDEEELNADGNHVSIPVHSDFSEYRPRTREAVQRELARSMSEHLVQAALLAGARDNITVMLMLLPGSGV